MTDILCNWLNIEVKLSVRVDPTNFAKEFSTGYLLGEVLYKYQLQDDFDKFSQAKTADSKLNNFTRVEPVLHLLEVPFDTNVARDVMTERHGVATRLMYQLFIALSKKQKNNLTGVAMETMRPPAPVKLENVESLMYKERLKHMTPRQTDLNLEALVERYHKKQVQMEQVAFKERFEEEERYTQKIQEQRETLREKHRLARAKKSEMLAKIQAATVHIPKPPANKTAKAIAERKYEKLQKEAEIALAEIEEFEEKLKRTLPPSKPVGLETTEIPEQPDPIDLIKPSSNDDYINMIRKRLNEDASARAEREKRRRKVLVDQIKAHEAQEDARREEMLVNRLMRQSQQERRIAVQLLQARHEKEVIRKNRMMREKQYEERRLKEFQEALNREAEIARLGKLEYINQTQKDRELHSKIMAERAKDRYTKHYNMCGEILGDIVDFSTKIGEYRELTDKLLPPKLMRDWTTLFIEGKPLYEVAAEGEEDGEPTPEQILEEERQCLLDEADFNEYRNMIGEWQPPEDSDITGPPRDNPIIGHIVQRLLDIVHPPSPPPPAPKFPPFPIKACIMGKVFSGKSTTCRKLAESHRLQVLDVEALVSEAIEAHKAGEVIEEVPEEENREKIPGTELSSDNTPASDKQGEIADTPQILVTPQTTASGKQSEEPQENKEQDTPSNAEDGMEKMDPEKPVTADGDRDTLTKSATSVPSTGKISRKGSVRPSISSMSSPLPQATPRAKLGRKAMHYLKKGRTVEDALLVDVVIEAIKRIPEGTGWILDGFPATYAQAKLLEKALTGMDVGSRENSKLEPKDVKGKPKKSVLAPDPRPGPPPPEPVSGLDIIIMLDIPDELALKRSAGRTYAVQADEQYHQEFKPPPEGAATGVNKQEKVIPVEDPAHDQDQIQHRLITFQDTWPKMEKWFSKFGILHKIEASQEQETVFTELDSTLEETLKKLQGPTTEETSTVVIDGSKQEEKSAEPVKTPEPIEEKPVQQVDTESRPSSKKGSRAGSRASSAEKKAKKSGSRASSKEGNKKSSGKGSRGSSPKSPKRSKSGGKKAKTPEPETEPEPEEPPGTPPPQPGSDQWQFVDDPIDEELAHILSSHWETVENTYIGNSKTVFRSIRQERERIIRYLHRIKEDFLTYLRRPDHKQEFVIQWQKEFNEIPDDLRDDEELRCELHQRVDDLRERLWSICDERKEQAEKERETIMMDGWVDDRVGILTNYYVTLVQGEVDRFQDTVRMLKDYYRAMEGKIPDESQSDFIRLPLVELPVEEVVPPEDEQTQESGDEDVQQEETTDEKPSSGKTGSPSGKKKSEEKIDDEPEEKKNSRIPLVPRRPASPDSAAAGAKKPDKAKSKAGKESEDGPPPPSDPDEKLLFDAYLTGVQAMEKLMASEQAAKEAEEEAEKLKEQEREAEKLKAATDAKKKGGKGGAPAGDKGGKGGKKSRSPSPKKGRGKDSSAQATPVPDEGEESEEEKLKKQTRERAKQEFFVALQLEASAAKCRMDLVRHVAATVIVSLKDKADSAYKDMNDWLGARFLKEMESIDQMSEVMRFAIENGTKIHQELKIDQQDFFIDQGVLIESSEDIKVLRSPSPQSRPDPIEKVDPETFTVEQIKNLYRQFSMTAPSGMMSLKTFQEILTDVTSLSHGTEQLPEAWLNLSPEKLESIAVNLSADGEYIDWHGCLLQLAQPWPIPTQAELLETLERFKGMDQSNSGYITREQYERVDLWFNKPSKPPTPEDISEPLPYDRLANLKTAFFDIFADHSSEPARLDYVKMLLHFSIAPDPYDGFLRALSVASGTHMPRLSNKKITIKKPSRPSSEASLALSDGEGHGSVEPDRKFQDDIPEAAINAVVPLDALDKVLHHGLNMRGDSHRFSVSADPEDAFSKERLAGIYQELGGEDLEPLPYSKLIEHPVLQDIVSMCNTYRILDMKAMLTQPGQDTLDAQSLKTGD